MAKTKQIPVHVEPEWHDFFKEISKETGIARGEIARTAIRHFFKGLTWEQAKAKVVIDR